jgi:hypothetical protein
MVEHVRLQFLFNAGQPIQVEIQSNALCSTEVATASQKIRTIFEIQIVVHGIGTINGARRIGQKVAIISFGTATNAMIICAFALVIIVIVKGQKREDVESQVVVDGVVRIV